MAFLRCCLLFTFVIICSLQQFVESQYLFDEILAPPVDDEYVKDMAHAIYKFTVDYYDKVHESEHDGNVFFSPASVYLALAMIYEGSEGDTKEELELVLNPWHFSTDEENHKAIRSLLQTLGNKNKKYTLNIANRLFARIGLPIKETYQKIVTEYFQSGVELLNFRNNPNGSRSEINSWVERTTSGKIKNLFSKYSITNETVLALANAVYFNCSWLYRFNRDETETRPFNVSKDKTLKVPMMHREQRGLLYAVRDKSFRLLELPYNDPTVSMIIALEDKEKGFDELLTERLPSYSDSVHVFRNVSVQLLLPKFTIHQIMNLKRILHAFGMSNQFDKADLSGIVDDKHREQNDREDKQSGNDDSTPLKHNNKMVKPSETADSTTPKPNHKNDKPSGIAESTTPKLKDTNDKPSGIADSTPPKLIDTHDKHSGSDDSAPPKPSHTDDKRSQKARSARLTINDAYHDAFITVDESGTEAARATGFEMAMSSAGSAKDDIVDFNVNRPFMFLVVEKTTGCILFFGHIKNPLKTY